VKDQPQQGKKENMKRLSTILLAGILMLSACGTAAGVEASHAWARPAAQGGNGAVYFLLQNHSASEDELTGVTSDVAAAVEMHESKMQGDVMQMQQVMALPIAGKASIEFAPGGYHVMLIGLKQDLKVGDEFQVILQFRDHDDISLSVTVQESGDNDSMSDH
jgi:copper(I)-binding protein